MIKEYWIECPVFEKVYLISNLGRVKNKSGNIMKPYLAKNGYYFVTLNCNSKRKTITLHRLIALAFIPNPLNKTMVNHIDGCKTNNDLSNLEWCTPKENSHHAWKCGLMENSRQKAIGRMSEIGRKYKEQNGDNLRRLNKLISKKVEVYNLNWEKIAEYESIKELTKKTGIIHQVLKRCITKNVPHKRRGLYFKVINPIA